MLPAKQNVQLPQLWNTRNYICPTKAEDIEAVGDEVEYRSSICCDSDLYEICIERMVEGNFVYPLNFVEDVTLNTFLRTELNTVMCMKSANSGYNTML